MSRQKAEEARRLVEEAAEELKRLAEEYTAKPRARIETEEVRNAPVPQAETTQPAEAPVEARLPAPPEVEPAVPEPASVTEPAAAPEAKTEAELAAQWAKKEEAALKAERIEKKVGEKLREVESVCEEVEAGRLSTDEALKKLSELVDKIQGD
jgi:hypothetical protein